MCCLQKDILRFFYKIISNSAVLKEFLLSTFQVDRQASVIDLTANLASDQGSTEIAHRSPSNEDFTQSKSPHAVGEVEELTQPPQSKRPPLKVPPKVPARHHHKSESSEICARDNSSQPTQLTTGGATPQPQAKKNEEKITKPKVPPRPAHPS